MMNTEQKPSLIQDLWERRFFQYIGTYLGVSFGLIQFAQFLEDRYELQNNLVEKAFIFLLVMLPAVALYIYNHGRRGHDEWKPIEKFFLPASLVAAFGLSLFLFNQAEEVEKVSITTEDGEVETRIIPSAKTARRLVLFPFQTDANTDAWHGLAYPFLLDKDLEQDMRTYAIQPLSLKYEYESYNLEYPKPISFSTQIKIAQDNYSDYFISGSIQNDPSGKLSIINQVYNSNTGELFYADTISSNNIYSAVDLFSKNFSEHLYIKDANSGQTIIDRTDRNDILMSHK